MNLHDYVKSLEPAGPQKVREKMPAPANPGLNNSSQSPTQKPRQAIGNKFLRQRTLHQDLDS